jgi:hypothetical protein
LTQAPPTHDWPVGQLTPLHGSTVGTQVARQVVLPVQMLALVAQGSLWQRPPRQALPVGHAGRLGPHEPGPPSELLLPPSELLPPSPPPSLTLALWSSPEPPSSSAPDPACMQPATSKANPTHRLMLHRPQIRLGTILSRALFSTEARA